MNKHFIAVIIITAFAAACVFCYYRGYEAGKDSSVKRGYPAAVLAPVIGDSITAGEYFPVGTGKSVQHIAVSPDAEVYVNSSDTLYRTDDGYLVIRCRSNSEIKINLKK